MANEQRNVDDPDRPDPGSGLGRNGFGDEPGRRALEADHRLEAVVVDTERDEEILAGFDAPKVERIGHLRGLVEQHNPRSKWSRDRQTRLAP